MRAKRCLLRDSRETWENRVYIRGCYYAESNEPSGSDQPKIDACDGSATVDFELLVDDYQCSPLFNHAERCGEELGCPC